MAENERVENDEAEIERGDTDGDLSRMSDKQLFDLIDKRSSSSSEAAATTAEQEEAVSAEPAEPAEDEAAEEDAQEPVTAETAAEAADEIALPSEADMNRLQMEALQQENKALRQREAKAREDHDKLSGKVGSRISALERDNRRLRQMLEQQGLGEPEPGAGSGLEGQPHEGSEAMTQLLDEVRALRQERTQSSQVQAVIAEEGERFRKSLNPKTYDLLQPQIVQYVTSQRDNLMQQATEAFDAEDLRATFRSVLADALRFAVNAHTKQSEEREQKQAARLRKVKRAATAAGSTPRKSSGHAPTPKSLSDLTDDQLAELMRQQGRRGF